MVAEHVGLRDEMEPFNRIGDEPQQFGREDGWPTSALSPHWGARA